MSDILISLKPKFADLIYQRKKNVELRKNRPRDLEVGDKVYVYETSPEQRITGYFTVKYVKKRSTDEIVGNYILGTSEDDYWEYVGDRDSIIIIGIKAAANIAARPATE